MQSIWCKHLIICLFLGLLAILLPGSGVQRRRQLDHTRFQGAYLLGLHHVARDRCRLKFDRHRIISQVWSIAHSLLVNGAFRDSARRRLCLLRKAVARRALAGRCLDCVVAKSYGLSKIC
jgi:hypothetical protein